MNTVQKCSNLLLKQEEKTNGPVKALFVPINSITVSSSYYSVNHSEESSCLCSIYDGSSSSENLSTDDSEDEVDSNADLDTKMQGEYSLELFIDPLNPSGKAAHPTLQSKIRSLKQQEEILKKQRFSQQLLEMENKKKRKRLFKLRKRLEAFQMKLENIEASKETARKKYANLKEKLNSLHKQEQNHYDNLNACAFKKDQEIKELINVGSVLEQECLELKQQISSVQKKRRMSTQKEKIEPIIIRDGPSLKTNYKLEAKYLQYEIIPLSQRLEMLTKRAKEEENRRRNVEREVFQLRERISELNIKIAAETPGISVSSPNKKIKNNKLK